MVSEASQGAVPVCGANSKESATSVDLESATVACLRDLDNAEKISLETLRCIVNKNWAACEELAARAAHSKSRVKGLQKRAQKELGEECRGGSAQTIFSDFLGSLGLMGASPEAAGFYGPSPLVPMPPPQSNSSGQGSAWQPVQGSPLDVDAVLEELRSGPSDANRKASTLLSELEALRHRFTTLRTLWPKVREKIELAYKNGKSLHVQELKRPLKEACSWRICIREKLCEAEAIATRLEDFLDRCEQEREERLRWRAKANDALLGLEKPIAARVAALTWLRRARSISTQVANVITPGNVDSQLEEVCGAATISLEMNIEAAELAQRRLVKCAAAVMRVETEHTIVTQGVGRLSSLKTNLLENVDAVAVASDNLLNSLPKGESSEKVLRLEAAIEALTELLEAIDEALEVLRECPIESQKTEAAGAIGDMSDKESNALRDWVRSHLLIDEDEHE